MFCGQVTLAMVATRLEFIPADIELVDGVLGGLAVGARLVSISIGGNARVG